MESVRVISMLVVAVLSQSTGNVLLSRGMKAIAGPDVVHLRDGAAILLDMATSPMILAGTALFVVFFALWTAALSRADLSFVLPAVSFEVVLNVAFAQWFLGEQIPGLRWAGVGLIVLGVSLVIRSGSRTFDRPQPRTVHLKEATG